MDRILTKDLALAFQLVSENEKLKNKKIIDKTKEIVSAVIELTGTSIFFKRKNDEK